MANELKRARKATNAEVDAFLKGSDPQEHIIKIECGYDDKEATVIYRDENFQKYYVKEPFYPFCWVKTEACKLLFNGHRNELKMEMADWGISCKGLIVANENGFVPERMENGYRIMFYATRPMTYSKFQKFFERAGVPMNPRTTHWSYGKNYYKSVAPAEQFMMSTGKRLFKGYESYDDLLRMQFDIETSGLNPKIDTIDQIGIRTNKGFEKIITVTGDTPEEYFENAHKAMCQFYDIIAELDPDVISGYNSENFDWNFFDVFGKTHYDEGLADMSKRPGLEQGVYKKKRQTVLKLGGEMEYYYPTVMWGKHITDCLFSVRRAQALDSNMKKATLKYVTKYSKINKPNRVYVPGKLINKTWEDTEEHYAFNDKNGDWYKITDAKPLKDGYELKSGRYIVQRYLLDDIWETDKVELRYNESNFLVGKMLPVNFERMCTMGTATIWKYIMMAWSYEHDLAIPLETPARSFTGGLSRLLTVGYIPNVEKLDYNSMYPSSILTFKIKTQIDISDAMSAMLEYILTQREYYKGLKGKYGKEAKKYAKQIDSLLEQGCDDKEQIAELKRKQEECDALSTRNDKMQLPLKITANAFFGSFGAGGGIFPWSDIDCAEETTCCGRQELRLMLYWFTNLGYRGIVCDTDGMNFKQPAEFRYTEEHPYVSTGLNRNTEEGKTYVGPWGDLAEFNDLFMRGKNGLDIDEFVPSSCYIARKNYIDLLDVEKQKVKLVGNTIKSKKMPIYIEKFVDDTVRDLLFDRGYEYLEKYYDKIEEIYNLRIPLKDIATVGKIKMSLDEYKEACKQKNKAGNKKARQAWYELAIKHNLDVHMGDAIYYINTGKKKGDSDVKRETHYYCVKNGERVNCTKDVKKIYEKDKKDAKAGYADAYNRVVLEKKDNKYSFVKLDDYVKKYYPEYEEVEEIIFNCVLLTPDIVEDEDNHYCDDDFEYNVAKYIEMFNSRIKPQLVCFDKSIRTKTTFNKKGEPVEENNIRIKNPKDRKAFTREQAKLVSGQPYKETDQDTYEQLMTMEDKEIRFWLSVNKEPVFWRECGMDWEAIKADYHERMEQLKQEGIKDEYAKFTEIIEKLKGSDIEALIEDGTIPVEILKFCDYEPGTGRLISKKWNVMFGTIYDIIDKEYEEDEEEEEEEQSSEE